MLLVDRPRTPPGFNHAAREARAGIRNLPRPASNDFADTWTDHKHVLAKAQGGRCGYCDRQVLGGEDGTVDHYRPKARVTAPGDDPSSWGTQHDDSASVTDRKSKTEPVSDVGYHWLAYAWSNYVFACSCCNVAGVELEERVEPPQPLAGELVLADRGLVEAPPGVGKAADLVAEVRLVPPREGPGLSKSTS